jgi:hypothetical protein
VTDWTILGTAAITAASAVAGAVLGYFSSKLQGKVTLEQARVELDKLRLSSADDRLKDRRKLYADALGVFDELQWTRGFGGDIGDRRAASWSERYREIRPMLFLVQDDDVRLTAYRVNQLVTNLFNRSRESVAPLPMPAALEGIAEEVKKLARAMRDDLEQSVP